MLVAAKNAHKKENTCLIPISSCFFIGFVLQWFFVWFFLVSWLWENCFPLVCFVHAQLCELSELCINLRGNRDDFINVHFYMEKQKPMRKRF